MTITIPALAAAAGLLMFLLLKGKGASIGLNLFTAAILVVLLRSSGSWTP